MARISLAGFKDPVRRPRYIIWTGVDRPVPRGVRHPGARGDFEPAGSAPTVCHKVQDDTIIAYSHSLALPRSRASRATCR